jgi:hypothetical protein
MRIGIFLFCLLLLPFAGGAPAGAVKPAPPKGTFAAMDKDGNGRVDREEFQAAFPNLKSKAFEAVDADADGTVSLEEWKAFRQAHTGARQSAMPPGSYGTPAGQPLIRPPR